VPGLDDAANLSVRAFFFFGLGLRGAEIINNFV